MFSFLRKKLGKLKEKIVEKVRKKEISEREFESFWDEMEPALIEANIAIEVLEKLREELKKRVVGKKVERKKVRQMMDEFFKSFLSDLMMEADPNELLEQIRREKPFRILFVGVNGVGKTTTIAKVAKWLKRNGFSCVFAASDTFRAASIEQLEELGRQIGVKTIKYEYGADAAAVAFEAIRYAKAHNIDVVLIDSAGRQYTNVNLMDELAKIKRVSKANVTIFVCDALTGNDAIYQALEFQKIGYDYIIVAKADLDEKGGTIVSISYVTRKPILFLGVGQGLDDLEPFKKEKVIKLIC